MEIRVSSRFYWNNLDNLDIPHELRILLRGIIGCHLSSSIMPAANAREVRLAQEHLSQGIWIDERPHTVMVFVPVDPVAYRSFFALMPGWPNGTLRRLEEI